MAGTASWIGGNGVGLTWTTAGFTATNFNSLASGSCVVGAQINNSTALDLYSDLSFSFVVGGTTVASSFMALYLLPLNQDGSTYGDGTASGATAPSGQYQVGAVNVKSGVASGSAVTGLFRGIVLPPGNFIWAMQNSLSVALSASAAAVTMYRTYNENLNR